MKYKFIFFIAITVFIITSILIPDVVAQSSVPLERSKIGIVSVTKNIFGQVSAIKLIANSYYIKLDEYGKRLASMDGQEVSVVCTFSEEGDKRIITVQNTQQKEGQLIEGRPLLRRKGVISVIKDASGQVAAIRLIVSSYEIPLDEYSKQLTTMDGRKVRLTGTFSSEGGKRLLYVRGIEDISGTGHIPDQDQ